ncbi:hypothetical protein [Lentilactobacillus hilgardii]|uniref:hypothetical protein n=1 Tax=Lentilactobacillus hilgardii TaxID=1588 RepID=UPI000551089C|nr:hypothetical protein [Lentilactobacillus hilgardii]
MTGNQEWYSLTQANQKLGRGRNYVSNWINRHQEFPEQFLLGSGTNKLISDEGIEWIKNHIKKEGVLVSNGTANGDQHLEARFLGVTLLIIHFTGRVRGKLVV